MPTDQELASSRTQRPFLEVGCQLFCELKLHFDFTFDLLAVIVSLQLTS